MSAGEWSEASRGSEEVVILPCGHDVSAGKDAVVMGLSRAVLEHQRLCRGATRLAVPLWAGPASPLL
ncbi:MAG: hypothetical protein L3K13_01805 [Thermoplasmata archaeon]|nr:hypothetical protein [Thermoplasmata archaeon]